MAIVFNPGGRRARYGLRRRYQPITDINVTPLVDVMLVLLIIFMVTAPMIQRGVGLQRDCRRHLALVAGRNRAARGAAQRGAHGRGRRAERSPVAAPRRTGRCRFASPCSSF